MTSPAVLDWLAERDSASPAALASRVRAIAAAHAESAATGSVATGSVAAGSAATGDATAAELLRAAGAVLERLLRDQETERASALELLAADALATYAMEALGDCPERLEAQCEHAMRYFAERADTA
ncbi:MAG: hypothetical protein IT359_19225 [Gemmatimonadaceae bacterium]|nr:hypothetical protein [Gemmatimonadaceae bacterium]